MIVPVPVVGSVPVPVVHVVSVVSMRHGDVAAPLAVGMAMGLMRRMPGLFAFVHVVAVQAVDVAIMGVVGVVHVGHRDVTAARAVLVRVISVRSVLNRT